MGPRSRPPSLEVYRDAEDFISQSMPRRASCPARCDVRDRPPTPHPVVSRRGSQDSTDGSFEEKTSKGAVRRGSLSGLGSSLRKLQLPQSLKSGMNYLSKHLRRNHAEPAAPAGPLPLDTPGSTPRYHDRIPKSQKNDSHRGVHKNWEMPFPLALPLSIPGEIFPRRRSVSDVGKVLPLASPNVDGAMVSDRALLKGWLDLKLPHSQGQGWAKVWCAVDSTNHFYIFDNQTAKNPIHCLDLKFVDVIPVPKSKKPWIVQVNSHVHDLGHGTLAHTVHLRLKMSALEDRDMWLKALTLGQQTYPYQRSQTRRLSTPELDESGFATSSPEEQGDNSSADFDASMPVSIAKDPLSVGSRDTFFKKSGSGVKIHGSPQLHVIRIESNETSG